MTVPKLSYKYCCCWSVVVRSTRRGINHIKK